MTAVNGNGVQSPQTAQAATKAIGLPTPGEFGIDVEPYDKGESDLVDKVMLLSDKAKLELLSDIDVRAPAPAGGTRRVSQTRTGLLWCRRACRRSRRVASPPDATARSARRSPMARTRSSAHGLTAHAAWHRSHTTHTHAHATCFRVLLCKCKINRPFFFFKSLRSDYWVWDPPGPERESWSMPGLVPPFPRGCWSFLSDSRGFPL